MRVLVTDPLGQEGLDWLKEQPGLEVDVATGLSADAVAAKLPGAAALVVRSGTQVTRELLAHADSLRVIGRAGIGVDNIDVPAATERGILVINTPAANATTTAELAIAHLLSLSRKLPQADRAVHEGRWAAGRKIVGREVAGKTLGIVGYGQIGRLVAERARGLRMRVLAFDPLVTPEAVRTSGAEPASLEELLAQSDYVSLHCPLTSGTRHLLDAARLALMKPGAFLVNCARGGLVDEQALHDALASGRLGGAALDVFENEPPEGSPLLLLDNVVATPHLGASTAEAQAAVSNAVVRQVAAFLLRGEIAGAVNLPPMASEDATRLRPWQDLARHLGRVLAALAPHAVSRLELSLEGEVAQLDSRPLASEALGGFLASRVEGPVNRVNAAHLAKLQGIACVESRTERSETYVSQMSLSVSGDLGRASVAGTLLAERLPRLVRIDDFRVEVAPEGSLLVTLHEDRPGVVGAIGTLLGQEGVNISRMAIGLSEHRPEALALLGVDRPLPEPVLQRLRELPAMRRVIPVPA